MNLISRILFAIACHLIFVDSASAQTIHAVLITDTLDGSIGPGISENRQSMRSFLENVHSVSELKVEISEVTGANFNCKSIIGALDKLSTSTDDVILFYYSGHGFREDSSQTQFPQFDCRRTMDPETLGLSEAVKSIRSKPARLVIAIADTCNRKIEPFPSAAEAPPPGVVVDRKAAFLRLFKEYRGTLTMSGSIPGEFSWYMTAGPLLGGFFTNQLLRAINENIDIDGSSVRWESIAKDAIKPIYVPANPPTTQNPQFIAENLRIGELAPATAAAAQEPTFDEVNPADLRRFWIGDVGPLAAAPPFVLTTEARSRFSGTFGIDVSHYTFDINTEKPDCRTLQGYATAACSCTADWDMVSSSGVRFVYSKASDGAKIDLSFPKVWKDLQSKHTNNSLLRGAYHFLRPGIDADKQADAFLHAIGATNGQTPPQLSPVLDIEWSNKQIIPGTPEFLACPQQRRTQNDVGNYYCDMWYVMTADRIAELAKKWIDRVEKATKLPVTIYTNPTAWWNAVMTKNENYLLNGRPVWTSRYTVAGPQYNRAWTAQGGSEVWKMAPLPRGASYPEGKYTIPHFWQFTEIGSLPSNFLTCGGTSIRRALDMNFIPVSGKDFPVLVSDSRK